MSRNGTSLGKGVPLDDRHAVRKNPKTGLVEDMPDLHPDLMKVIDFLPYSPPPPVNDETSVDEWTETMNIINDDLQWLLSLNYSEFWCQVIFDNTLKSFLDLYLMSAPRSWIDLSLPSHVQAVQQSVHRRVFMVFLRMTTNRESQEDFLSDEAFAVILYENFLLDIPKMMDLCVLYGGREPQQGNTQLLTKMLTNVFTKQPKYTEDLQHSAEAVLTAFDKLKEKVVCTEDSMQREESSVSRFELNDITDIICYAIDIGRTLLAFIHVYHPAASVFHRSGFIKQIVEVYEVIVQRLESQHPTADGSSVPMLGGIKRSLQQAKTGLVMVVYHLFDKCCLSQLTGTESGEDRRRLQEEVFDVMASVLSSQSFVLHYDKLYPVVDQVGLLKTHVFDLDATQIDYLEQSIRTLGLTHQNHSDGTSVQSFASAVEHNTNGQMKEKFSMAGAIVPSERELSFLIGEVQEVLPHLGTGFIEACLEEFSWNAEQVVHALLEDKIPPALQDMDRQIERTPSGNGEPSDKPGEDTVDLGHDVLSKRQNVFDNDEMDVFRHAEVNMSRVKFKERERKTDALKLLDDKSLVSSIRDRYLDVQYDEYDDEYDDTYDSTSAAPHTTATDVSGLLVRRLNEKVPLYRYVDDDNTEQPAKESEETEEQGQQQHQQRQHLQQPQKEQSRLRHGAGAGRGQGHQSGPGQKERAFKEKHKGSWANHNRKMAAQKKRSKGMGFPT